jgi:hypothetical protein
MGKGLHKQQICKSVKNAGMDCFKLNSLIIDPSLSLKFTDGKPDTIDVFYFFHLNKVRAPEVMR